MPTGQGIEYSVKHWWNRIGWCPLVRLLGRTVKKHASLQWCEAWRSCCSNSQLDLCRFRWMFQVLRTYSSMALILNDQPTCLSIAFFWMTAMLHIQGNSFSSCVGCSCADLVMQNVRSSDSNLVDDHPQHKKHCRHLQTPDVRQSPRRHPPHSAYAWRGLCVDVLPVYGNAGYSQTNHYNPLHIWSLRH